MSSVSSSLSSGTGLDVQATVDQLIYTERAPERLMQQRQSLLDAQTSAMRDLQARFASLEESVRQLKDFTGALATCTATSSAPESLTATADSGSVARAHSISIQKLATISSYYTKRITDPAFKFDTGSSLTVQIGDRTPLDLEFDGKTLEQAADYVNGLKLGVKASTVVDAAGTRLAFVSEKTGLPGSIKITNDLTKMEWQTSSPGQNAELLVDGVPVQSASNQVSGVIPGVTLTLNSETSGSVQVTVGPDKGKAKQAVSNFVANYNAVVSAINAQFKVDGSTNTAGVLAGDSTLRDLQSRLFVAINGCNAGNTGAETLRSIGVEMQNDGTLTVNQTNLDGVVQTNYEAFRSFFQDASSDGFAQKLDETLSDINDSTQGPIALDLKGIQNTRDAISDQIDSFEVRIEMRQKQLLDEYTRVDMLLRQLPALQSQISAQLGSLNSK